MLNAGDVEYIVHNFFQPFGILLDHLGKLLVPGVREVFVQQGVGLGNRGQRVSNFVGDGSGHPAHARQLVGSHSSLHFALILKEHDAKTFRARALRSGELGPNPHAPGALSCMMNRDVRLLGGIFRKTEFHQVDQTLPSHLRSKVKRAGTNAALRT